MTRFTWTPERLAELTNLWNAGLAYKEIAARMGINERSVDTARLYYKLPPRRKITRRLANASGLIRHLYEVNLMSTTAISEYLYVEKSVGYTPERIRQLLIEMGVPLRSAKEAQAARRARGDDQVKMIADIEKPERPKRGPAVLPPQMPGWPSKAELMAGRMSVARRPVVQA